MAELVLPDGRTLGYEEWGTPDGPPLVYLHGTPGCRLNRPVDPTFWTRIGLRVITIDRPGYGVSSDLLDRSVHDVAADVAVLADSLGIGAFRVYGGSGGGPHALACAAALRERVTGAAVVSTAAPLTPTELENVVEENRVSYRVMREEGREGLVAYLRPLRDALLADPIAAVEEITSDAATADQLWNRRPEVQARHRETISEALRAGVDGWVDDAMALFARPWCVDFDAISCPVRFWHSDDDRNGPLTSIRRLADQVPGAVVHVWHNEGHTAASRNANAVYGDLLAATGG